MLVRGAAGGAERRWPLAGLKRAVLLARSRRRVYPAPALKTFSLVLTFANGRAAIGGAGEAADFTDFCRLLLAEAAAAAPRARFLLGRPALAEGLLLAAALLALGAACTLLFALSSDTAALGIDLAARLVFALLLLAAAWPWLCDERRRGFDPLNPPL